MPVITKIAQQKKLKRRYSIFLDEKYAFSVEEDVLIAYQLAKGNTLSEEDIAAITEKDEYSRAYAQAINYLSYRMRTIQEMEDYLKKKEIPQNWLESIIIRLLDEKLLNDAAFAEAFVRDRMNQTTKGPKYIQQELSKKGIKMEIVKQALQQYTVEKQYERVSKWLMKERQKKSKDAHKKQEEKRKMKLFQQGFNQDVIHEVFADFEPEYDWDSEKNLFMKQAEKLHRKHSRKLDGFELEMKLKAALFQKGFQAEMIDGYIDELRADKEGGLEDEV